MKIDYKKCGDYYIPKLIISNTNNFKLGKYGKIVLYLWLLNNKLHNKRQILNTVFYFLQLIIEKQ